MQLYTIITMIVTIPACVQHEGIFSVTVEIQDTCPKCGAKRGIKQWKGLSYDGSLRLSVDLWENECGHIDKYSEIREEVAKQKLATKDASN